MTRSHPGKEDGSMFEHLIEGKRKQMLFKDSQGGLAFPGLDAEQPVRDQAGEISRGQIRQDCVYHTVEHGFYFHDNRKF